MMNKELPKSSQSGCKFIVFLAYIGVGILLVPIMFFLSVMAHDAPSRNSLQTGTEIFDVVFIVLYLWGLIKINKWGKY